MYLLLVTCFMFFVILNTADYALIKNNTDILEGLITTYYYLYKYISCLMRVKMCDMKTNLVQKNVHFAYFYLGS